MSRYQKNSKDFFELVELINKHIGKNITLHQLPDMRWQVNVHTPYSSTFSIQTDKDVCKAMQCILEQHGVFKKEKPKRKKLKHEKKPKRKRLKL